MENKEIRIKKKIGQVVCCGFFGTTLTEELKELIEKYYVGNIIYFTRNYENPNQMLGLNKEIYQEIISYTGLLPFTAIDQEGGNVTRMMNGVTFPPSPMSTAVTHVKDACYLTGRMIGLDMISLGLNLNLAPCLDINNKNPFFSNIRHYSDQPEEVATRTADFIRGVSEFGVLSCLKHFPGCGEDVVDTHFDASILNRTVEEIENHELIPFIHNIDTPCIMTTHTIFKALDDVPSTLSHKVITDYLRNKLHYQGVVITDALEMNAIANYYGAVEASLISLKAGADMILCCHDRNIQIKTLDYLYQAVLDNKLLESELDEKIERIKKQKERLVPYLEKYFYHNTAYQPNEENNQLAYEIVKNSYQLLYGEKPTLTKKTLFLAPELYAINGAEDVFDNRSLPMSLKSSFDNDVIVLDNKIETEEHILNNLKNYDQVIAFSYNVNIDKINQGIINKVNNQIKTYIISLKGKMDIELYDNLINYSVLYEYTPNSIKTIIEMLKK